mmetsp:Transcript_38902/g.54033  ORF Transcript_38902/g.54033 Transcript_38902/m.54033 type:complete len:358 (+) Transcript_38902:339-1412(+)
MVCRERQVVQAAPALQIFPPEGRAQRPADRSAWRKSVPSYGERKLPDGKQSPWRLSADPEGATGGGPPSPLQGDQGGHSTLQTFSQAPLRPPPPPPLETCTGTEEGRVQDGPRPRLRPRPLAPPEPPRAFSPGPAFPTGGVWTRLKTILGMKMKPSLARTLVPPWNPRGEREERRPTPPQPPPPRSPPFPPPPPKPATPNGPPILPLPRPFPPRPTLLQPLPPATQPIPPQLLRPNLHLLSSRDSFSLPKPKLRSTTPEIQTAPTPARLPLLLPLAPPRPVLTQATPRLSKRRRPPLRPRGQTLSLLRIGLSQEGECLMMRMGDSQQLRRLTGRRQHSSWVSLRLQWTKETYKKCKG